MTTIWKTRTMPAKLTLTLESKYYLTMISIQSNCSSFWSRSFVIIAGQIAGSTAIVFNRNPKQTRKQQQRHKAIKISIPRTFCKHIVYLIWNSIASSFSFERKIFILDLVNLTTFWRRRGNGAVESHSRARRHKRQSLFQVRVWKCLTSLQ